MTRKEVKTRAAAEKAIKDGQPIRIVGGQFALAIMGLSGVDIEIAATARVEVSLTDTTATVAQADYWSSRVVARGSSRVVAWESSTVEAWGSSRVEAWGSSRVVAWESSTVVARESSTVEAWGSSRVEAWGYSMLQVRHKDVRAKAAATVAVNLWAGATAEGGRQQVVDLKTPADWCDYYGLPVNDGIVIAYKAVRENFHSARGGDYTPGTVTKAHDWDGGKVECGCGLHFSPHPQMALSFDPSATKFVGCPIRVAQMAVHFDGDYPGKCKAPELAGPCFEVDRDGNPVAEKAAL